MTLTWGDAFSEGEEMAWKQAQRMVDAYRVASGALIPSLSHARLVGFGYNLMEGPKGEWTVTGLNVAPFLDNLHPTNTMTEDDLIRASDWAVAGERAHPAELNRDLRLRSEMAHNEGDYMGTVVYAAAAAETLIDQLARALIWEQESRGSASWTQTPKKPQQMYPGDWIDAVFEPALSGAWRSAEPVQRWDAEIRLVRNQVMHEGRRLDHDAADAAFAALTAVTEHILDQLARRARDYPRTAMLFLGHYGLSRRGALGTVRASIRRDEATGFDSLAEFRSWSGPTKRVGKQ